MLLGFQAFLTILVAAFVFHMQLYFCVEIPCWKNCLLDSNPLCWSATIFKQQNTELMLSLTPPRCRPLSPAKLVLSANTHVLNANMSSCSTLSDKKIWYLLFLTRGRSDLLRKAVGLWFKRRCITSFGLWIFTQSTKLLSRALSLEWKSLKDVYAVLTLTLSKSAVVGPKETKCWSQISL